MKKKLEIRDEAIEAVYSGLYGLNRPFRCRAKTGEPLSIAWCQEEDPPVVGRTGFHESFTREEAEFNMPLGTTEWFESDELN